MVEQSRESEKQILSVQKDVEHLQYVLDERLDDIKSMHKRLDHHMQTDLDFHENVRKKISARFETIDDKIRHLDKWKWATWGALIVIGTLIGYFTPVSKLISLTN